jgi:hypothetical protein
VWIKQLGVRVFNSAISAFAVAAGLMIFPSLGLACEGGKTLFEDKFEKLNPAWGFSLDPATEKIDPSGYAVDFPPNAYRRGLSQIGYYNDHVVCATFTTTFTCTNRDTCESQPYVGLVVLANDNKNFYTFEVSGAYSSYSLTRVQNGKYLFPVAWTALPDNKKFISGEKFEIQATVKGSTMSFKVNGKPVLDFEGVAPEGGSLVGFEVSTTSTDTKNSQISVSSVVVKELSQ